MAQMREGMTAIREAVDINVAARSGCSPRSRSTTWPRWACTGTTTTSRPPRPTSRNVVTTHTWEERWDTCGWCARQAWRSAAAASSAWARRVEQRAEFAAQLGRARPDEVPLNFLNPRPGTPFGDLTPMDARDALRTIAAFRLALPRTILRYAGGREITLGDLGTRDGLLGGINAVIVGNYLTTLGRTRREDLALLDDCRCRSRP